ncbi:hypothetical protein ACVWZV_000054 [Bradyrhizobium sp. GM5.1]
MSTTWAFHFSSASAEVCAQRGPAATFFGPRTILGGALIATARSVHNSETGRLSVGFCTSLSDGNLQASLLEFKQRFPQSTITDTFSSGTS